MSCLVSISVLVCFLPPWCTPWPKRSLGEKGLFQLTVYSPSRRVRAGAWRPGRDHGEMLLNGLLSMAGSFCFLTQSRATCLKKALRTVAQAFAHQSLMKNMPHRLAHQADGSFFPDDSNLNQVGRKKSKSKKNQKPNLYRGLPEATMSSKVMSITQDSTRV